MKDIFLIIRYLFLFDNKWIIKKIYIIFDKEYERFKEIYRMIIIFEEKEYFIV